MHRRNKKTRSRRSKARILVVDDELEVLVYGASS
jgi:hypothetical protein